MKYTYFETETLEKDLRLSGRFLYSLSNSIGRHYHLKRIEKEDGSFRTLCIPDQSLKYVQKRISEVLLSPMPVSSHAKAYGFGSSPCRNAKKHLNQKVIVKLDIRAFFDHITYAQLRERVFGEDRFSRNNSILLCILCTFDGYLPQGSPASPAISNILMYDFDESVGAFCQKRGIVYTRY